MPRKPNSSPSSPKKKAPSKKVVKAGDHPVYQDMILEAVESLHERTGSSHSAILKYISTKYQIPPEKAKVHIRLALKKLVAKDVLLRVKASFKLADGTKSLLKKKTQEQKKKAKGKDLKKKSKDSEKKKADDKKQKDKEKEKKQKEKEKEKEKKQKEKEKKQKEKEKSEKAKKESPKKRKFGEVSRSPRKSTRATRASTPQKNKAGTKSPSKRVKSKWLV